MPSRSLSAHFLKADGAPNRVSSAYSLCQTGLKIRNKRQIMHNTRQEETIKAIKRLEIPTTKLSRRAGVETSRVSEYVRGKILPTVTTQKIESAVRDIAKVWDSLGIKTELDDTEGFDRLLAYIHQCETEQLANETVRFAALAGEGLNASCSVSEQKDI